MLARVTPFAKYSTKELGIKVTLRIANDYTAVIEGQKNRHIHIGQYGPRSIRRTRSHRLKRQRCPLRKHRGTRGRHRILLGECMCARRQSLYFGREPAREKPSVLSMLN